MHVVSYLEVFTFRKYDHLEELVLKERETGHVTFFGSPGTVLQRVSNENIFVFAGVETCIKVKDRTGAL